MLDRSAHLVGQALNVRFPAGGSQARDAAHRLPHERQKRPQLRVVVQTQANGNYTMLETSPPSYALISPVRDEARHIRRTLEAIVAQTHLPSEWVIVDDGSTDATRRSSQSTPRRIPGFG